MAEKLNWNYLANALNGPSVSGAGSIEVDAYDKFAITVTAGATQEVNLVPGDAISLLIINPKPPSTDLSYALGGNPVALDGPHLLIGAGAVSLLGTVTSLKFTNNTGSDAVIEILIGRDATS